jgi:imidazole glycerol-phosphate synthase subunit HisH
MKSNSISIIDYGLGNLMSVTNALKKIGEHPRIIDKPDDILNSSHMILPGVGAFEKGITELKARGLVDALNNYVESGRPLLGICLGMQLLMSENEEFGMWKGLDLLPGKVISFVPPGDVDIKECKIPHMGWNELHFSSVRFSEIFNIKNSDEVYFVHAFYVKPKNDNDIIATTEYAGINFCSIIKNKNVLGFQFHPEKSGVIGLKLLKIFCNSNIF